MNERDKYHQLYDRLLDEVKRLHELIKVGIRQGLKMLVIVPLLFMVVMFLTQGSKGIFLVLWIVSTFVLAAFLIALEYVDHGIQKRLEAITGMESELPDDPLMPEIDIEELRLAAQERRSQLPLHKLKEKLANGDASDDSGEASEEAAEAEAAAEEAAEPIVEAPFIFEELPEEEAAAVEALETELAEAAEEAAETASAAEPAQEAETDGFAEPAGSETEDAEDVVKV